MLQRQLYFMLTFVLILCLTSFGVLIVSLFGIFTSYKYLSQFFHLSFDFTILQFGPHRSSDFYVLLIFFLWLLVFVSLPHSKIVKNSPRHFYSSNVVSFSFVSLKMLILLFWVYPWTGMRYRSSVKFFQITFQSSLTNYEIIFLFPPLVFESPFIRYYSLWWFWSISGFPVLFLWGKIVELTAQTQWTGNCKNCT